MNTEDPLWAATRRVADAAGAVGPGGQEPDDPLWVATRSAVDRQLAVSAAYGSPLGAVPPGLPTDTAKAVSAYLQNKADTFPQPLATPSAAAPRLGSPPRPSSAVSSERAPGSTAKRKRQRPLR